MAGQRLPGKRQFVGPQAPSKDGPRASLAFAAPLGQAGPARTSAHGQEGMKRIAEIAWPVIGLGAAAVAFWLLIKELRGLSFASLSEAIASISLGRWLLAISSAVLAYLALAWYDRIALLHLGRKIGWLFVSLTALTTYAIAHTIGASMLSGAVIRYRAYSSKGLSVTEIGLLVAFCSFTFGLGVVTLGGMLLLFHPELVERFDGAPDWVGKWAGAALFAAPALYLLGSLLHFRPFKPGAFQFVYPRPPVAARQLVAGPLELIGRPESFFRDSGGRQSWFRRGSRRFSRLVLVGSGEPCSERARGA